MAMIQDMPYEKTGIRCRTGTLRRALRRIRSSYRKPGLVPYNAATPEEQEQFKAETNLMVNKAARDGFTVLSCEQMRARLWSSGGCRWRPTSGRDAVDIIYSGQSVSVFGVLGSGSPHLRTVDACNSGTLKGFLREMLRVYPKILLILDNAPYHKSGTVTSFVEDNKDRLRLALLPAHAPQLNPMEQQWNVPKRLLAGRCFASLGDLRAAIAAIARRRRMRPVRMMNYLVAAR